MTSTIVTPTSSTNVQERPWSRLLGSTRFRGRKYGPDTPGFPGTSRKMIEGRSEGRSFDTRKGSLSEVWVLEGPTPRRPKRQTNLRKRSKTSKSSRVLPWDLCKNTHASTRTQTHTYAHVRARAHRRMYVGEWTKEKVGEVVFLSKAEFLTNGMLPS